MNLVITFGIAWAGLSDYKTKRIPRELQAFLYVAALFHGFIEGGFHGLASAFLASMAFFIPGYLLYRYLRAMAGADVKVASIISAWCGIVDAYMIVLLATLLALICTILINCKKGIFIQELKTTWTGIYLKFICRVKGDTGLDHIPEDINADSPPNTVPFVTFLALAVMLWQI